MFVLFFCRTQISLSFPLRPPPVPLPSPRKQRDKQSVTACDVKDQRHPNIPARRVSFWPVLVFPGHLPPPRLPPVSLSLAFSLSYHQTTLHAGPIALNSVPLCHGYHACGSEGFRCHCTRAFRQAGSPKGACPTATPAESLSCSASSPATPAPASGTCFLPRRFPSAPLLAASKYHDIPYPVHRLFLCLFSCTFVFSGSVAPCVSAGFSAAAYVRYMYRLLRTSTQSMEPPCPLACSIGVWLRGSIPVSASRLARSVSVGLAPGTGGPAPISAAFHPMSLRVSHVI